MLYYGLTRAIRHMRIFNGNSILYDAFEICQSDRSADQFCKQILRSAPTRSDGNIR